MPTANASARMKNGTPPRRCRLVGKCLPVTATEVVVELKPPPVEVFAERRAANDNPNRLRFRLTPDLSISLVARPKQSGDRMIGEEVELVARHDLGTGMPPYQRRALLALFCPTQQVSASACRDLLAGKTGDRQANVGPARPAPPILLTSAPVEPWRRAPQ
jgi:hypothetical protein